MIETTSFIHGAAIVVAWWFLFAFLLPIAFPPILAQTAPLVEGEGGLSFWEKIWIFILYAIAVILTVIGAFVGGIVGFWLAIIAGFFTLLATFWWLFEFMIWPWEKRFWDIFFSSPWWAYLLGLLVLVPVALIIAILLGAGGWLLVLIAALVALLWLGIVFRCGWILWIERQYARLWVWWVEVFWALIEVVRRIIQAEERWFTEKRERWVQVMDKRCVSWHWLFKWFCDTVEFFVVGVSLVVEYVVVKLIVYFVSFVIVLAMAIVTLVVGALLLVVLYALKLIFWCW